MRVGFQKNSVSEIVSTLVLLDYLQCGTPNSQVCLWEDSGLRAGAVTGTLSSGEATPDCFDSALTNAAPLAGRGLHSLLHVFQGFPSFSRISLV